MENGAISQSSEMEMENETEIEIEIDQVKETMAMSIEVGFLVRTRF